MKDFSTINWSWHGLTIKQRHDGYLNIENVAQACEIHTELLFVWIQSDFAKGYAAACKINSGDVFYEVSGKTFANSSIILGFLNQHGYDELAQAIQSWGIQLFLNQVISKPQKSQDVLNLLINQLDIGYVYFIQNLDTLHVKIGKSQKPIKRLKALDTANSAPLAIVKLLFTLHSSSVEKGLHSQFSDYVVKGEWFSSDILNLVGDKRKRISSIKEGVELLFAKQWGTVMETGSKEEIESFLATKQNLYKLCLHRFKCAI